MIYIDTHCHVNSEQLRNDTPHIFIRAAEAGVQRMLLVGFDLSSSLEAVKMAKDYASFGAYASIGIHPHDAKTAQEGLPRTFHQLLEEERVVAVGETGLDYYYDHSPRDIQRAVFRMHIELALCTQKPLIVHVREAWEDTIEILLGLAPEKKENLRILFHCYSGGIRYLEAAQSLNAYISLAGPVTWSKSEEVREVAKLIPSERLLLETDSPWLAPKPYRGKLNEPAYVGQIYETVASVRGVTLETLAQIVNTNAAYLFKWGSLYV